MSHSSLFGPLAMVIGAQWGDEGKGKLVDLLCEQYDAVARCQGGANAGHTIVVNGVKHVFHLVPSGALHPNVQTLIGSGVVVHLETLFQEIDTLESAGIMASKNMFISDRAHIVTDLHIELDGAQESRKGDGKVGTTKRGIGPTYEDKAARIGLRMCDFQDMNVFSQKLKALFDRHEAIKPTASFEDLMTRYEIMRPRVLTMLTDVSRRLHDLLAAKKHVLIEGANGALLDLDHGTYPYVTSSNTLAGGAATGLGVAPHAISHVIGVVKAYTTRVGGGPFPTELTNATGEMLRSIGGEYGATTGRPRRCGWLDIPILRYTLRVNGIGSINLTKLDVLDDLESIQIATAYKLNGNALLDPPARLEDWENIEVVYETMPGWKASITGIKRFEALPKPAQAYVLRIEELLGVPIRFIGTGPGREQMIAR